MASEEIGKNQGFTLIELLVVVAIISLLTGIAVPNFLSAQTRSRAARAKADLSVLGSALESYRVDFPDYPKSIHANLDGTIIALGIFATLPSLTTPVAYLTQLPKDPFLGSNYQYFSAVLHPGLETRFQKLYGDWILLSVGPDKDINLNAISGDLTVYDPSNGTISQGDIIRSQKEGQHGSH